MNFNPQNEQGILGLVAALKAGMDPSSAGSAYSMIQQDQAADVARRQERLGGLAEMLMGAATQGTPYAGAEALADAAPGPMGPAVQQMLAALYPTGDMGPAPTNASGAQMDFPSGSRPGDPLAMAYGAPDAGPTATSPAFVPQGPSPTEQIAMQNMEQEQAISQALSQFASEVTAAKAKGWPVDQVVAQLGKTNPELLAVAGDQVQQILTTTYGEMALSGIQAPQL